MAVAGGRQDRRRARPDCGYFVSLDRSPIRRGKRGAGLLKRERTGAAPVIGRSRL